METKITKSSIQDSALKAVLPHKRCTAVGGTGVGKTLLGLKHMSAKYHDTIKYLVVASKVSIFEEWKNQAMEHGYENLLPHIRFCTYFSLTKQNFNDDIVYFDEIHNLLETHEPWLIKSEAEMLGLTGTPPVNRWSKKYKIINKYCPIVFEYAVDDAVKDGVINDYEVIVHMLDLDERKNIPVKTKTGNIFYTSEKANYDYWTGRVDAAETPKQRQIASVMRMKQMKSFKSKEILAKKIFDGTINKTIMFAGTKQQADALGSHTYYSGNPKSKENLAKFKTGEVTKLVAINQLSEGVNIPNLKEGIIIHSYSGNSPKTRQMFGRLLRLFPNEKCTLVILCYRNTVDEGWVAENLSVLDPSKIIYV